MPSVDFHWRNLPSGSTVLVTGGGGFIGARLTECLSQMPGLTVRCLVRSHKRAVRLRDLPVEIIEGGTLDPSSVAAAVSGANYVIHCAYDSARPQENILGTENLLEACASEQVERFVHLSSFAVYQPFQGPRLDENSPDGDRSIAYVDVKLQLEHVVLKYSALGRVPATILQPTIVYGPHCWVWTRLPAEMLLSGQVVLPDGGSGICNLVHVDDLVDAILVAATEPGAVGKRFIASGPDPVTWRDYFSAIAATIGAPLPVYWPARQVIDELQKVTQNRSKPLYRGFDAVRRSKLPGYPLRLLQRMLKKMKRRLRKSREIILPSEDLMNMYLCPAAASNDLAEREIGYRPRVDLVDGMKRTSDYLQRLPGSKVVR